MRRNFSGDFPQGAGKEFRAISVVGASQVTVYDIVKHHVLVMDVDSLNELHE